MASLFDLEWENLPLHEIEGWCHIAESTYGDHVSAVGEILLSIPEFQARLRELQALRLIQGREFEFENFLK